MIIRHDDIPMHVEIYGEGPTVFLLHGFLENSKIWDPFIADLSTSYRLICPDFYGHGETPQHGEMHSMELFAEAILTIMQKLEIEQAAFIGHSMGGYVAMAMADLYPERVTRLLLLNSSPQEDSEIRKKERQQVIKIVQKHKPIFMRSAITNLFAEVNRERFSEAIERHIIDAMRMETSAIVATVKGMKERRDREAVLADFAGVKWLVAGEHDNLIPLSKITHVAQHTGAELKTMLGGHMSYIEQRDAVSATLKDFLMA